LFRGCLPEAPIGLKVRSLARASEEGDL
jgi:hypothetical protein